MTIPLIALEGGEEGKIIRYYQSPFIGFYMTQKSIARIRDSVDLGYSNLSDLIYARLQEEIMGGSWKPGAILTIATQAERFKVSPTPVREAMLRLVSDGALVLKSRSFYLPILTTTELIEIRRLRVTLEELLTLEAVKAPAPVLAGDLEVIQKNMIKAKVRKQYESCMQYNREFHFRLYREAQMPQTLAIVRLLWSRYGPYQFSLYLTEEKQNPAHHDHLRVIKAVRVGNGREAAQAIVDDLTLRAFQIERAISAVHNAGDLKNRREIPNAEKRRFLPRRARLLTA